MCFTAGAVDTLDDMDIDPYGDLQQFQQEKETAQPSGSHAGIADQVADEVGEGSILYSVRPSDNTILVSTDKSYGLRYGVFLNQSAEFAQTANYSNSVLGGSIYNSSLARTALVNGYETVNVTSSYSGHVSFGLYFSQSNKGYLDFTFPVSLAADLYTSITLNGDLSSYFKMGARRGSSNSVTNPDLDKSIYPSRYRILVNGVEFGQSISFSNGLATVDNLTVDFSSLAGQEITSIGYRVYYAYTKSFSGSPNRYLVSPQMGWFGTSSSSFYNRFRLVLYFDDSRLDVSYNKSDSGLIGGGSSSGTTEEGAQERHEETKGLLNTIISWLKSIVTGITELPGKIVSALLDGLKTLFIPSEEDLQGFKDKYQMLLSERLGFIWQAGEWITSFGSEFLTSISGGSAAELVFPGVSFPMNGEIIELIPETPIDFTGNGIVKVVQPFLGTLVALVVVGACVNLFHGMVTAFVSGKSYFDFLKGGGDV